MTNPQAEIFARQFREKLPTHDSPRARRTGLEEGLRRYRLPIQG